MISPRHLKLLNNLESSGDVSWAHRALYGTLLKLRDGGPTQHEDIMVHDAWVGPGDRVNFLYQPPWMSEVVGLSLGPDSPRVTDAYGDGIDHYAWSIADFNIAEPLGMTYERFERDGNGIGWWGDPPFPGVAGPTDYEFWNRGWS